jgi:hypothetical protein
MNHPLLRHFRRRRMNWLQSVFQLKTSTRVLDVGGTILNWQLAPVVPAVTLLNMGPRPTDLAAEVPYIQGDARDLSRFADGQFDLVYSNSVIEHLGTWPNQQAMARELARVGRALFVQTPDPRFPVEPHLMAPFIHWLPRERRRLLLRWATPWGWTYRPSAAEVQARLDELRLVNLAEMRALFPQATIRVERFVGLPKSIIAYRTEGRAQ